MSWSISRKGKRGQVLGMLDELRDVAKRGKGGHEAAQCDTAAEMIRATLMLAGRPRVDAGAPRVPDERADEYPVEVRASGEIAEDGSASLYISVSASPVPTATPPAEPPAPTAVEYAAELARQQIVKAAKWAAPPDAAQAAGVAAADDDEAPGPVGG